MKITTPEMEIALAQHFNFRQRLIVPNVSWGMYFPELRQALHECDLLICTSSGYLWECEIKISKADLIKDKEKWHRHFHPAIRRLYFAIPESLMGCIEYIPERAGIVVVKTMGRCDEIRKPKQDKGIPLSDNQRLKMAMLGTMRIWSLKKNLLKKQSLKQEK